MTAADDARQAINTYTLRLQADGAEAAGDPVMLPPDEVRTIAQHLDDGAVALRLVDGIQEERFATTYDPETGATVWEADISDGNPAGEEWVPLADVDPEAASLLARLEADRG